MSLTSADEGQRVDAHPGRGRAIARLVPPLTLLVIVVVLALANTQRVTVDLLFKDVRAPLILVLAVTALAGALIAAMLRFRRSRRD